MCVQKVSFLYLLLEIPEKRVKNRVFGGFCRMACRLGLGNTQNMPILVLDAYNMNLWTETATIHAFM